MSKSLNGFFLPLVGGTALVLGSAFALTSRDYGASKIETLESRVGQVQAQADQAVADAKAKGAEVADLSAQVADLTEQAKTLSVAVSSSGGGTQSEPAPAANGPIGLGREALPAEIAAWDVDVLPDGRGLPEGRGDAYTGEEVFADRCAICHGDFAEGVDNWPVLAGGFDTLADKDPVKTVGSYWPHLSTVWDYVNRSMPFGEAQTLTADEVYAIVAYILYSNDLVDDDFELSHENFGEFEMYNKDGFIIDNRPEVEYTLWRTEPCMENCKESVEITKRASFLDVTPEEEGGENEAAMQEATHAVQMAEASTATTVAAEPETTEEPAEATEANAPVEEAALDPELVAKGEKVFKKCKACHQVGDGAKNKTGPHLNGVMGRAIGGMDGFKYSKAFKAAAEEGRTWTDEEMIGFLTKPKAYFKGTKMSFGGLKKEADMDAILAYLKSFGAQ